MNRLSFRLVFNRSLGSLVAVAECARGRSKSAGSGARAATTVLLGGLLGASTAWAEMPVAGADVRGNFATFGQAGYSVNGNKAFINQVGNKAILNWQKFNISPGATVQFGQVNDLVNNQLVQGASFTTLNRIWDIKPSVIAGAITQAAGQKANVILVNSNGVAFMGGSQVNLNSFTATTLNMADEFVTDRLLGDLTKPQFEGALGGGQARGFIKVFEGANITADSQGRVMLIAPTVVNRGTVQAPDGQVILAAGTKAYLRSDDSRTLELRGLLVEVDNDGLADLNFNADNTSVQDGELDGTSVALRSAADDKLGHATNAGTLSSSRGNVTMVGYAVNQNGIARATSSVVANGSVYLMAKDTYAPSALPYSARLGQLVMGAGSLTEVLPEVDDKTTTTDGSTGTGQAAPSQVVAMGQEVYMAGGSTIRVPSGSVRLMATRTGTETREPGLGVTAVNNGSQSSDPSRVHVAAGATIDVAGLRGVQVAAGRNTVEVELRGDELKDSPVNQVGPLRGEKAWVDVQQALDNAEAGVDTLIAKDSLEGYAQRLERTVAERSTAGGQVVLDSAGSVIVENGATINLSGGSVAYQQDTAKTTVLSSQGTLVDLADALATTRYDAIASRYTVDYGRWNQKETIELTNSQRVVQGYTDGQNAGSLFVFSPGAVYLQPNVVGSTVSGERQQASGNLPRSAQVFVGQGGGTGAPSGNALAQNVRIERGPASLPTEFDRGSELSGALQGTLSIDADLLAEGRVGELSVLTSGAAEVRSALRAQSGGKVDIGAQNISVGADITAAGGAIRLAASNLNPLDTTSSNRVDVADGVTLSTAGTWVNRLPGSSASTQAPVLQGGSIDISASSEIVSGSGVYTGEGSVHLGQGVRLDASGGAMVTEQGQLKSGAGGDITIDALKLQGLQNASLSAYGLDEGGSLSVTTRNLTIGGPAPASPAAGDLHLAADFLSQGGFASYDLRALENLEVADNTTVRPLVAHRDLNADFRTQATNATLESITTAVVRDPLQREGAHISLTALENATDTGEVRIGHGASIEVDPGASIALTGRKQIAIEGSLVARGGDVTATLKARPTQSYDNQRAQGNLFLGDNAVIDVSGVAQTETDDQGQTQGKVLAGGSVALLAETGALVSRAGSRIDVSGAEPVTLGERGEAGDFGRIVASDAGSLSLRGNNLFLDGALSARAGSATQRGGNLLIGAARDESVPNSSSLLSNSVTSLELFNHLANQADAVTSQTEIAGSSLKVATDPLEQAGFERLRFASSDGIALNDGLDLGGSSVRELQLDAARIQARGDAQLTADAVRLGNYHEGVRVGSAGDGAQGAGTLTASGRLVELAGNLRLQGMDRSELTGTELVQFSGITNQQVAFSNGTPAVTGPFRHTARIQSAGDLILQGGVVAPGGFAEVQVQAPGRDVSIASSGATPVVPLSALGSLSIEAQNITQAGHLVAPFGQISLNATNNLILEEGSVTSVAGTPGQVLPVGQLLNGIEWRVNLQPGALGTGQTTLNEMPGKELRLTGAQVALKSGSTVNLSGGGDLQAYEFTAGPGGSRDILTDANTYAIIPGYQSGFAPDDAQESTGLAVGEAVYLKGVKGLADGRHVLLPAHYALLPGAMVVRFNGDAAPISEQSITRQDGVQIAAGYLTDSRPGAPRGGDWQGVQVLTQEQLRARSEFTLARASTFFAGTGPLPQDAGLLSLATQGQIQLDATIQGAGTTGGKGLAVDVSAPNLVITSGPSGNLGAGVTELDADKLTALKAGSLLLGATREDKDGVTELTVNANSVTLQNDAAHALKASEVMLAARDTVTLASGSVIDAQGADGNAGAYSTAGNGAFVRAASTSATFNRTGSPDRSSGALNGASDALIQAAKSITVDATQNNGYAGQTLFRIDGKEVAGELSIGASRISFGQPATVAEGITLGTDALKALQNVAGLTLTSYSSFDLYGAVEVGGQGSDGRPLLDKLTLEGGGLTGLENTGTTASLRARDLTLSNAAAAVAGLPSTQQNLGNGALTIEADKLTLGQGEKTVSGYSTVDIRAKEVVGAGAGKTTLNGQTSVRTQRLTGNTGADQTLDTGTSTLEIAGLVGEQLKPNAGLGANWTVKGSAIGLDTRVELHSGSLTLEASSGDVVLGENTDIDVSGRDVEFFNVKRGTWGGDVTLASVNGNVTSVDDPATAAKAKINVSGAAGADGGTLTASAVRGEVDLSDAALSGQALTDADGNTGEGARVRVDANTVTGFSAFNQALNSGGFEGERTLRTRSSAGLDVASGDVVRAAVVNLTADGGALTVAGTVSASGKNGGHVALHGRSVTLTGSAHVEARATDVGGEGGRVHIGAQTLATEAASGDNSRNLDLQGGSTIDVSGGGGGTVHLRAQRKGSGVAVTDLKSTITGAREVNLEAVRVYEKAGNTTLNVSTTDSTDTLGLTKIDSDNTDYAANANHSTIKGGLGQATNTAFHVLSGVEIRSSGDITLGADWNMVNSAAGGEAGVLTLRAGGNLNINNNLSDGFKSASAAYASLGASPEAAQPLQADSVRGGRSWSYNMVAGADMLSADVTATLASDTKGDVNLAAGKLVRTGTGDISVSAGRDVRLASNTSVIYTAGKRATALSDYSDPTSNIRPQDPRAYFTEGGGNVNIEARRDVVSARSTQLYSEWLWRVGRLAADAQTYATDTVNSQVNQGQTAWWVRFDQFQQGVGALGGGNVNVVAGRDVKDLSVSAPTQGRMNSPVVDASKLVKTGGGDVRVDAGSNVLGGQFYADEGDVKLFAGNAVGTGSLVNGLPLYPVLAIGNGDVRVNAHGDLNIQALINPHLVVQSSGSAATSVANLPGAVANARRTLFSTYGEDSTGTLNSLTGDTVFHSASGLAGSSAGLTAAYTNLYSSSANVGASAIDTGSLLNLLPSSLSMTAFDGDVNLPIRSSLTLLPSSQGQLELLAMDSISMGKANNNGLLISDRDPATIPSAAQPVNYLETNAVALTASQGRANATAPVHTNDSSTAKVYAVNGDITWLEGMGQKTAVALTSSKAVEVRAGGDIKDFNLRVQHANATDRSVVQAGGDISFAANEQRTDAAGIRVAGLGVLEVSAGRDINLGTSGGILSRGDLDNNNLPQGGASIEVIAGVGKQGFDAEGSLQRLADRLSAGAVGDTDLWLVRWLVGDDSVTASTAAAALAGLRTQSQQVQRSHVREMVFTALRSTGRAANEAASGYAGTYDRGYAALELVFPGISKQDASGNFTEYQGNINLFASRIKTERGGDIDFMIPGGGMVVGLANTAEQLTNVDGAGSLGALGVVAASTGAISGFARDDVLVNQSRILTVGGGDILLWSSEGDLDAGRGKKTASSVPPPIIRVDSQGNVVQELQGAATGSGIGALKTGDADAGDVDLFAPKGTVNAGDAGIRAGNLNIGALVVLGADNISVSGSSAGTPVADTSAVSAASSGATSGSDDTGKVVEALNQAAADSAKAAQELASALRPSVVRVDVLGFGE